jgi:hypothetical protein
MDQRATCFWKRGEKGVFDWGFERQSASRKVNDGFGNFGVDKKLPFHLRQI